MPQSPAQSPQSPPPVVKPMLPEDLSKARNLEALDNAYRLIQHLHINMTHQQIYDNIIQACSLSNADGRNAKVCSALFVSDAKFISSTLFFCQRRICFHCSIVSFTEKEFGFSKCISERKGRKRNRSRNPRNDHQCGPHRNINLRSDGLINICLHNSQNPSYIGSYQINSHPIQSRSSIPRLFITA